MQETGGHLYRIVCSCSISGQVNAIVFANSRNFIFVPPPPPPSRLKTMDALRNQPHAGSGSGKVQSKKKASASQASTAAAAPIPSPPPLISSFLAALHAQAGDGRPLGGSRPHSHVSPRRLDLYAAAEIAAVREECESLADNDGLDAWAADCAREAQAEITSAFSDTPMQSGGGDLEM